jgi:hypothetical protein
VIDDGGTCGLRVAPSNQPDPTLTAVNPSDK